MRVLIEFELGGGGGYSPLLVGQTGVQGIYRFQVSTTTGAEVNIGESQDLCHRTVRNYASAHTGPTTRADPGNAPP
jgi:hypothetical protein